jgi:Ycf4
LIVRKTKNNMVLGITETEQALRFKVIGCKRLSTYLTATALTIGGVGFFLASISSYTKNNILPFTDATQLLFFPQGIVMGFYGVLGSLFALYYWLTVVWDVGSGYNEFNRRTQKVTVYRNGFPGKNREIELVYPFKSIQGVRVVLKEGLNPRRLLYLKVKGKNDIRLSGVGQPPALAVVEDQAAAIARFMDIPVDGL